MLASQEKSLRRLNSLVVQMLWLLNEGWDHQVPRHTEHMLIKSIMRFCQTQLGCVRKATEIIRQCQTEGFIPAKGSMRGHSSLLLNRPKRRLKIVAKICLEMFQCITQSIVMHVWSTYKKTKRNMTACYI